MQTLWGTHAQTHILPYVFLDNSLTSQKRAGSKDLSPSRWEKMVHCPRTGNVSSEKVGNVGRDQSSLEEKEVLLTQIQPALM